jgi:cell division protein ZapB
MEAELKALEEKINQFVQVCQNLRADNHHLRQQLATSLSENKQLETKIDSAKKRLEALLRHIPEYEK